MRPNRSKREGQTPALGRPESAETPRPPPPAAAAITATPTIATGARTPPPPIVAAPTESSPVLAALSTPRSALLSSDAWSALSPRDQIYSVLAFVSSRDGLSADAAACLTLMSPSARAIGVRAVDLGASQHRVEDPEVARLLSAPKTEAVGGGAGDVSARRRRENRGGHEGGAQRTQRKSIWPVSCRRLACSFWRESEKIAS